MEADRGPEAALVVSGEAITSSEAFERGAAGC